MNKKGAWNAGPLLAFLLGLVLSGTAAADDTSAKARELINKMTRAAHTLNYEGVFIYSYGNSMDTMRIIHKSDKDGEYQRLVSLTGSPREVIRDGDSVTCIFPDDRAVMVEKSRSRRPVFQLPQPIESVSTVYKFSTSGTDRVAGRDSWVVDILPRDKFRYGYKLWIDRVSHLLLKSELRDSDNDVLEQILFTQLAIRDSIPAEKLEPSLTGKDYTWYENDRSEQPAASGGKNWRVTWMPDGFDKRAHQSQAMPTSREPVEHMVYTDGIAIVSVFVERLEQDGTESIGASRMGGVNTFAKHDNGYQITAIGEVPPATVEGIAKSVVANN